MSLGVMAFLLAALALVVWGLFMLVKALSAAASRAYFAEKEKHIKRVIETVNNEESK